MDWFTVIAAAIWNGITHMFTYVAATTYHVVTTPIGLFVIISIITLPFVAPLFDRHTTWLADKINHR